jgi:acetyltransferase
MTRTDVKKHGIGLALTELLIDYAKTKGIGEIWGQVMRDNAPMLVICRNLGIQLKTDVSDPIYLIASLRLK